MSPHANGPADDGAVTENRVGAEVSSPILPRATDSGSQDALPGIDRAIENADAVWWSVAMRAVHWLAETPGEFDAWDVTKLGVPDPDHPNRWGALFRAAATAGIIEKAGYTQSRRPGRAGGLCRVWRGRST